MSEPLKSIHVRLSGDAYRVLCALSEVNDKDNAEMLRTLKKAFWSHPFTHGSCGPAWFGLEEAIFRDRKK
jgi:hypothetical protein